MGYLQVRKRSGLVNALVQLGLGPSRRRPRTAGSCLLGMKRGLVEQLRGLRDVKSRVLVEESIGLEHDADTLHRHHGEVFNAGIVGKTKG
jgi:hypothetical protein